MTSNVDKAIVLLSGGLDSTTVLAIAKSRGYEIYALSFDYGQRHQTELSCAKTIATSFNVSAHLIMPINMRAIGGSALTDSIAVPKDRPLSDMTTIPVTYVPARNTIFLAFATAWAEVIDAHDIFIGVNAVDYSGYPDCRPDFIRAFERMANLATKAATENKTALVIHTPLIDLSKEQIIRRGIELGIDYSLTSTCYDPPKQGTGCGRCDACLLRLHGFNEAGISDPLSYEVFPSAYELHG